MNKHILVAMDRKNRTKKELLDNVAAAVAAADAAYDAAYDADSAHTEHWLAKYFEITGENKQGYINAIEASK